MTGPSRVLLIETATRRAVVGLADMAGALVASEQWSSGHRHGEELLPRLDHLLSSSGTPRSALAGVAVGTGPGSFTGLRIGMATAKTIAYGLAVPIVGVPTIELLASAGGEVGASLAIVLPAGVGDRYVGRYQLAADGVTELEPPTLVAAADVGAAIQPGDTLLAVDLPEGEALPDAVERGERSLAGLAAALAQRGARALSAGESDELAALVPRYVALPRGVPASTAEVAWSPDLR